MTLTARDVADLTRIEAEIEQDQNSFFRLVRNLTEIRDRKLYLKEFKTFDAYCRIRWGWDRTWVYKQINSAKAISRLTEKTVSTMVDKANEDGGSGINERQARAVADIPEEHREEAVKHAVAKQEPLTGKSIRESANEVAAKDEEPPKRRDETGYIVPDVRLQIYSRRDQLKRMLEHLADIRGLVRRSQESPRDPLFIEANIQDMLADSNRLYAELKRCIPYAVCPACQGIESKNCLECKNRGVVSEHYWNVYISAEAKEARAKALEDEKR